MEKKVFLKSLTLAVAVIASISLVACGKNDGAAPAEVPAVVTPIGNGPVGANVDPKTCQVGQVHTTQHGCLNQNTCNAGYGWLPGEARCIQGTLVTSEIKYGTPSNYKYFSSLSITNRAQFNLMLKYAKQCDFYWIGINLGDYRCDNWTNRGGFVLIENFGGSTVSMTIAAGSTDPVYTYNRYIKFSQSMTVSPINNDAGFTMVDGGNGGLRATIESGRLGDATLTVNLEFQNVTFATATVRR